MRRHRVAVTALARMPAYVAGAVCAAGMAACSNVMASGAAPTGASESRQAPNPLADRLTGMGPIERDVYRRVYEGRTGIEQAVRLQKMSYEELVAKTDFARWEIDPAEFARNLETKRRELAAMKARHDRRMRRLAQEKSLLERAEESRAQIVSGRKSWTSFWKHEQYLALFQTCFLHPDKSGDYRWVAGFLADLLDPLSQALQEELKKPGFPASPFGKARSAADMFLIAEAYERAHPDFAARERAAHAQLQTVMGLLKAVAYEAWTFHVPGHDNGGMRRKKPMQTATFRYCGGFTSGNFGYRPLIECAMVHHDTRMMDIIKDVIEKSLSSRCGYHNQGDCFWMDGIKSEHTLFAHGDQNYILGYGQDYVREVVALGERLRGGCWKVEPRKWAGLADVFLDGYQWYVHQGAQEITIMGRHSLYAPETAKKPSGPRWSSEPWGKRLFFDGFRLHKRTVALAEGQLERQAEFDAMAERMKANEDLIGNRYFWNSEDLLHHRKLQYVCVNMSSVRVKGPEGATFPDHATLHNRLFGCGMTVLKRKGGDLDRIRGAWDYAALPGITFARGDSFRYSRSWESAYGKNIYSGGVSDGANGLCAFKYRQKGISLAVNKAYFAFD
ncbi:MAG: hypothetical protein JXR37_32955, partial [Kiritimatiellae bacterium]|nr:hypothetical protein [Kiritimatiellia bacterium]